MGCAVASNAALGIYLGNDAGANSTDPRPISIATAAAFDVAVPGLGPTTLINFESIALGSFSSLAVAPVVTLTGSDIGSANQTIVNSPAGTSD